MPFSFAATPQMLPAELVDPLAQRGGGVPLAALADGFREAVEAILPEETWFEVAVRIWWTLKTLDAWACESLEKGTSIKTPVGESSQHGVASDFAQLSTLYAALEYFIYDLTKEYEVNGELKTLPLLYNPFLTHWVEATEASQQLVQKSRLLRKNKSNDPHVSMIEKAYMVRLIVLQTSLENAPGMLEKLGDCTPHDLSSREEPEGLINLTRFYEMLYATGVWDRPDPTTSPEAKIEARLNALNDRGEKSFIEQHVEDALRSDPVGTYHHLIHLPIELASLELINKVLVSSALEEIGLDPVDLARNFIQHGLRDIEAMGENVSRVDTSYGNTNGNGSSHSATRGVNHTSGWTVEHAGSSYLQTQLLSTPRGDKLAQSRAIKLLVLFMKNLLKKGIANAEPAGLLYEIEEVCVRYMFVPEVREFRAWLEGELTDEAENKESW